MLVGMASPSPSSVSPIVNQPAGISAMPAGVVVGINRKKPDGAAFVTSAVLTANAVLAVTQLVEARLVDGLQNIIRRAVRPVKDGLPARPGRCPDW